MLLQIKHSKFFVNGLGLTIIMSFLWSNTVDTLIFVRNLCSQSQLATGLPPDMENCIAVGRPRTYRDCEKSALGFNAVLPN